MTFRIFEGAGAFAFAGAHRAPVDEAHTDTTVIDIAALFRLDDLSAGRTLTCRWGREPDGRLACHWEPDIVAIPQR